MIKAVVGLNTRVVAIYSYVNMCEKKELVHFDK